VPTPRRLEWDYTPLADAYVTRPDYADAALDRIFALTSLPRGARVLDLGAGAGHLTVKLAERGADVLALEPNPAMRAHGERRTRSFANVRWRDGLMEDTSLPPGSFSACAYGSSFGVADHQLTLREAARVLEEGGWFVCVFNHRVLEDPLQREIEAFIRSRIPGYAYGARRQEQGEIVAASGLFEPALKVEVPFVSTRPAREWLEAWRSHATLQRQAGDRFSEIVAGIAAVVARAGADPVAVPYVTRACLARRRGPASPHA
jgi:SAM-dependent methyltransferase